MEANPRTDAPSQTPPPTPTPTPTPPPARPARLQVFQIESQGDARLVEASTMAEAIELWRAHTAAEDGVDPAEVWEPDDCARIDTQPVIRGTWSEDHSTIQPIVAERPGGVAGDVLDELLAFVRHVEAEMCREVDGLTRSGRAGLAIVFRELANRASTLLAQADHLRELQADPDGGGAA